VPLPQWIFKQVPEKCHLFPPKYDAICFDQLQGVGPKIRHLIAEAGYHQSMGPAVDCHMIRFTCCMGSGCHLLLSGGSESVSELLKKMYQATDFPSLNEVPASIAQLLRKREHCGLIFALTP
jgi:endonuclease III